MDQIIVGIMAFFMVIGAVDKALFDGKFGYGKEFENGLNTMGPLALVMVGIMCVSPALGTALGPALLFSLYWIRPRAFPRYLARGGRRGTSSGAGLGQTSGSR